MNEFDEIMEDVEGELTEVESTLDETESILSEVETMLGTSRLGGDGQHLERTTTDTQTRTPTAAD